MAEGLGIPSMFDTRMAMGRQMEDDAMAAGRLPLGGGMMYASSMKGDLENQQLMGLAGALGGAGNPMMDKQKAIESVMQKFGRQPETAEDYRKIASMFNEIGQYDFAEKSIAMMTAITASQPKANKPATSIEEFQFSVTNDGDTRTYAQFMADKKAGGDTTIINTGDQNSLTVGQEAVDKIYATNYVEWNEKQGDMIGQVAQLETVLTKLESGEDLTGVTKALMPDWYNYLANPGSIAAKERVAEVVQRNLKLILGGQFSEKEGEQLIARAYNPALDEKENISRLKRLIMQMKVGINARNAMNNHFNQFGTMKGYEGKRVSIQSFYDAMEGIQIGQTRGNYTYIGGDRSLESSWKLTEAS